MTAVGAAGAPRPGARRPVSVREFAPHRNAAAYWAYVALTLGAALAVGWALVTRVLASPVTLLVLAVWAAWGGLAYAVVCRADLNRSVPGRVRLAALAWGALCLAYAVPLTTRWEAALPAARGWIAAAPGPLAEEGAKLLGVVLIALVTPAVFGRPLGALTVGMVLGLGFAIGENARRTAAELAADQQEALPAAALRLGAYPAPWAHLLFTGIAALGVWYVVAHRERPLGARIAVAVACFALATALHLLRDALASAFGVGPETLGYQAAELALLLALVVWARGVDRRWFRSLTQHGLPPVLDEAEAASLATRRSRRRARGAGAAREVQNTQLRYVNAVSDGDDSTAEDLRHHVRLLRLGGGVGAADEPPNRAEPWR